MIFGVIIVLVIIIIIAVSFVSINNGIVRKDNRCDNAWQTIDAQLQRRNDLIPNLVETVKGYAAHESDTLAAVTQARAAVPSTCTVQAPQKPPPQPNFGPLISSRSRRTQSSGMSGLPAYSRSLPLMWMVGIGHTSALSRMGRPPSPDRHGFVSAQGARPGSILASLRDARAVKNVNGSLRLRASCLKVLAARHAGEAAPAGVASTDPGRNPQVTR